MKCPGVVLKHKPLYTPFWSAPEARRLDLIPLLASGFGAPRSECIYCLRDPTANELSDSASLSSPGPQEGSLLSLQFVRTGKYPEHYKKLSE